MSGPIWPTPGPVWLDRWLTTNERKAWLYSHDPYFRDGWRDVQRYATLGASSGLERISFVLVKPDGIVARSVGPLVDNLIAEGFRLAGHAVIRFDRLMIRELWRYELSAATDQRFDAIDALLTATNSLVLVVEDQSGGRATAAALLSTLKGPSRSAERDLGHLRSRIGAGDGLLNFIHTPDEPADVVRELGVLLDSPARCAVLAGNGFHRERMLAEAYTGAPSYVFDRAACAERIERLVQAVRDQAFRIKLLAATQSLRSGMPCDWRTTLDGLKAEGLALAPWDAITFAAMCTTPNLSGVTPLLSG
jgi:nucleoside diphosphate kinase